MRIYMCLVYLLQTLHRSYACSQVTYGLQVERTCNLFLFSFSFDMMHFGHANAMRQVSVFI